LRQPQVCNAQQQIGAPYPDLERTSINARLLVFSLALSSLHDHRAIPRSVTVLQMRKRRPHGRLWAK